MSYTQDKLLLKEPDFDSYTAIADEAVSGGQLLSATGADDLVTSGVMAWGDLRVVTAATMADKANVAGIALQNTAASGAVAVVTKGVMVLPAGSDEVSNGVTMGYKVSTDIAGAGVIDAPVGSGHTIIGRALSAASELAASVVVRLDV